MIDFQNASYAKLHQINPNEVAAQIQPLLVEGEQMNLAFKGIRDYIVFTSKRGHPAARSGHPRSNRPRTAPSLGRWSIR